jgi:hypothetical protein
MTTPVKNLTTNAFDSDDDNMDGARSDSVSGSSISITPRKGKNQFDELLLDELTAAL